MQIKSIVAGAAIALIAGVGFASAADDQFAEIQGSEAQTITEGVGFASAADDQFAAVSGLEVQALTEQDMRETRGGEMWRPGPVGKALIIGLAPGGIWYGHWL